jgi:hypothetical protein
MDWIHSPQIPPGMEYEVYDKQHTQKRQYLSGHTLKIHHKHTTTALCLGAASSALIPLYIMSLSYSSSGKILSAVRLDTSMPRRRRPSMSLLRKA